MRAVAAAAHAAAVVALAAFGISALAGQGGGSAQPMAVCPTGIQQIEFKRPTSTWLIACRDGRVWTWP